jgi:hypothetical protein
MVELLEAAFASGLARFRAPDDPGDAGLHPWIRRMTDPRPVVRMAVGAG